MTNFTTLTQDQEIEIDRLIGLGQTPLEVATKMSISSRQIAPAIKRLAKRREIAAFVQAASQPIPPKTDAEAAFRAAQGAAVRKCLSCSAPFASTHAGNRICYRCRQHQVLSSEPNPHALHL